VRAAYGAVWDLEPEAPGAELLAAAAALVPGHAAAG
jgi:hypothetical protein